MPHTYFGTKVGYTFFQTFIVICSSYALLLIFVTAVGPFLLRKYCFRPIHILCTGVIQQGSLISIY